MGRKKTREEHIAELAVHGRLELLGDYISTNTKTLYRCLVHGVEQETTPKCAARGGGLQCCWAEATYAVHKRQVREAAATYDAELAKHGKVARLEPYVNSSTKILHRCLVHGEVHAASPATVRKGHGLKCCQGSGRGELSRKFQLARDTYDAKLAALGRLVRIGEYAGAHASIDHRCLEHNETHKISPTSALAGTGLRCCRMAGIKKSSIRSTAEAASRYDAELATHGKVVRLEPYVRSNVPILHRCLEHGEEHEASPNTCRQGHGLRCCYLAQQRATTEKKRLQAAETYDADLAKYGFVVRLGEYVKAHAPILHRCTVHGEEHFALPTNCRKGRKLICCRRAAFTTDSIEFALEGSKRYSHREETGLYIYGLKNWPGFLKPGIAKDTEFRANSSQGEYGDLISEWRREHRLVVYLVEQALLRDTRPAAQCPPELSGWAGATEVRHMESDALVALAQELMDEIDACANPWEFAIAHGLLTQAQEKRAQVLIQAGALSEVELAAVEVAA